MGIFFETLWLDAVLAVVTLCALIYHVWTLKYNYWKERNVPYLKPSFPFGNTKDLLMFNKFLGDFYKEVYFKLEGHKFGGIISLRKPQLVVRDPDIIKLILTKDFNHFTDRGIPFDEKIDPLSAHLFNLSGEKWRILRSKLTPTFTSGKMKMMFHLMKSCAKILEESLLEFAERGAVIEVKDFMARFGTDVIGACAFGLETESIKNPDNEFRRISKEVFKPRPSLIIRGILNSVIPGISRLISIKTTPKDREDFFFKIVHDTVEYREKNNVVQNDFLDLLIQIRNKGQLDDDSIAKSETSEQILDHKSSNDIDMTNELMTAQCFVFFLAGFETSSSALSFCLYELALNKVIQEKLQKEVDDVLAKYNGEVSYEVLKEMVYMDRVIQETLRKYPPAVSLIRECVADYTIKEENVKIEKGMRVIVPLFGIHYDPVYYPEPERFDPDRFTEQAKQSRPHYAFLPFGEGPRICIGLRFGLLEIKTALTALLSKYNFDCTPETLIPMEFNKKAFLTTPKEEIKLKISKRSN